MAVFLLALTVNRLDYESKLYSKSMIYSVIIVCCKWLFSLNFLHANHFTTSQLYYVCGCDGLLLYFILFVLFIVGFAYLHFSCAKTRSIVTGCDMIWG